MHAKMSVSEILVIYCLEPKWPLLLLERAVFWRVFQPKNRGQRGSRCIYSVHKYHFTWPALHFNSHHQSTRCPCFSIMTHLPQPEIAVPGLRITWGSKHSSVLSRHVYVGWYPYKSPQVRNLCKQRDMGVSKNRGKTPPNHPFVHRFSIIFTIHFAQLLDQHPHGES